MSAEEERIATEPHEAPASEGARQRGRARTRRAIMTTISSAAAQATGLATSLISVPLTIEYLGKERYGLWSSLTALLMWAALADFGIGRGLINHLSEAYAHDDREAAGRYVSTGLFALLGVSVALAALSFPLLGIVPLERLFKLASEGVREEVRGAAAAVLLVFLVNFPLSAVGPIYAAYQRSYVANAFKVVGNLLSLGVLVLATRAELGLAWLVMALGGVPLLMSLVNLAFITTDMPWLRPRLANVGRTTLRELGSVSTPLFLFQLGSLLINELQTLIIARRAGLTMVADYTVFLKVYSVPVVLLGLIDGPLLPSFREAIARGDALWLRQTFWRAQGIKLVICAAATIYYIGFGNTATRILSGHSVEFPASVWYAATLLTVVGTWNGSFNDLLISTNRLWLLVKFILANGVVTATLTYFAAERYGVLGIVCATTVYSLLVTAWIFPWICWNTWRRARRKARCERPGGARWAAPEADFVTGARRSAQRKREMRRRSALPLLTMALLAPTVAAEPGAGARLAYARTELAVRCPDEASLRAAVAKRLGYDPFLAAARQTIIVDISLEQEELVGRVRLVDADGVVRGSRDLRSSASDCEELAASLALAISITLDPSAAFDLKPPAEPGSPAAASTDVSERADPSADGAQNAGPAASAPGAAAAATPPNGPSDTASPKASQGTSAAPFELALRGGGLVAVGMAPSPNLGTWLGLGFGRGMLRGSVELRADFPASKAAPSGGSVHSRLLAANLSACLASGWAAFCLAGSLGQRNASASEVADARSESVLFAAIGARVEARLALVDKLWLLASVEGMGVLTPLTLRLHEQDVWSSPPLVGALQLGVQFELL